jgi:trimeric autotransporter adhesin
VTDLAIGNYHHFSAIAKYSDGSLVDVSTKVTRTSSNPAIATISFDTKSLSGVAIGIAPGKTNITASFEGKTSQVTVLTVSSFTIQPITPK